MILFLIRAKFLYLSFRTGSHSVTWNPSCCLDWPWIYSSHPASVSCLGLQGWATISGPGERIKENVFIDSSGHNYCFFRCVGWVCIFQSKLHNFIDPDSYPVRLMLILLMKNDFVIFHVTLMNLRLTETEKYKGVVMLLSMWFIAVLQQNHLGFLLNSTRDL